MSDTHAIHGDLYVASGDRDRAYPDDACDACGVTLLALSEQCQRDHDEQQARWARQPVLALVEYGIPAATLISYESRLCSANSWPHWLPGGNAMTHCNSCHRCQSCVCDGRTVVCLGCGTEQCHGNGHRNGSCSVCHFGILPGWSSWRKQCGYKGCDKPAAFHNVPGSVKSVCHDCAARPKITIYPRNRGERIPLVEYVARGLAAARFERGVVKPDEQTTRRCLFLSESDEQIVEAMIARARNYKPFVAPAAWQCPSAVPDCTEDTCRHVAPPDHAPLAG